MVLKGPSVSLWSSLSNSADPPSPWTCLFKNPLKNFYAMLLKLFCSTCTAVVISSSAFAPVEVFCFAFWLPDPPTLPRPADLPAPPWSSNPAPPWSSNPAPPWPPWAEEGALFAVKCIQIVFLTYIVHHCQTPHSHNISSVCLCHLSKPQSSITQWYGILSWWKKTDKMQWHPPTSQLNHVGFK